MEAGIAIAARQKLMNAPNRLRQMHDALMSAYGPQRWWPAKTRIEVIIGAYLTQNTSWRAVERSLAALRTSGALSVKGLRNISLSQFQELIRPSGFITRKAPALKAFIALLDAEFSGSLNRMAAASTKTLREKLLQLPGVGPETADAILLYAFHHSVPVADEYLRRIAERHQLLSTPLSRNHRTYESLRNLTVQAFANDAPSAHAQLYNEFHALAVAVGKAHCGSTPHCANCPLEPDLKRISASTSKRAEDELLLLRLVR